MCNTGQNANFCTVCKKIKTGENAFSLKSILLVKDSFLLVYYNQLPMNVSQIEQSIEHREDFIKFGRDFEPIR